MSPVPMLTLSDGVRMPQLGYGVYKIAPDAVVAPVRSALAAGYRLIDTAALYANEAGVGEAIASAGVPRADLFVTTKLWNTDHGYDPALRAFDTSLASLGLDYVDLYLIHWPSRRSTATSTPGGPSSGSTPTGAPARSGCPTSTRTT